MKKSLLSFISTSAIVLGLTIQSGYAMDRDATLTEESLSRLMIRRGEASSSAPRSYVVDLDVLTAEVLPTLMVRDYVRTGESGKLASVCRAWKSYINRNSKNILENFFTLTKSCPNPNFEALRSLTTFLPMDNGGKNFKLSPKNRKEVGAFLSENTLAIAQGNFIITNKHVAIAQNREAIRCSYKGTLSFPQGESRDVQFCLINYLNNK